MMKRIETPAHAELFAELKSVRAQAIEHVRAARDLSRKRHRLMAQLQAQGFNQSDLARELGVTRQAIQKMIAVDETNARSAASDRPKQS